MAEKHEFDEELIKSYPRASRKIILGVSPYTLQKDDDPNEKKGQTTFISPHGLEFQSQTDYANGTLLKINISLPEYWGLKQKLVDYSRIDTPEDFKILAKVVRTEDLGRRGKKKLVVVQTVNIDEVDELVLKSYLQEAK